MNILYFLDSDLSLNNAEYVHVSEVVNNLEKLGNRIYLIAPRVGKVKGLNVKKILLIPTIKNPIHLRVFLYQIISFIVLIYYISTKNIDLVYIRQGSLSLLPELSAFLTRRPVISELNGIPAEETKRKPEMLVKLTIKTVEKLTYKFSDRFVAVTEGIADYLKNTHKIQKNKIDVINNGANIHLFKPLDISNCRDQLGINRNYKIVCFVGNLAPWQGVDYLIKAAPSVLTVCPDAQFLIVGDGLMKEEYMRLAKNLGVFDKFIFTGAVPYEDVPNYINASDVCVHFPFGKRNDRVGASSLKLFEYMACGKPIITSDISGIPKEIKHANAGILVRCNLQEIADTIIKLLKDEKLRKEMGRNGRKCVVENHSWKSVTESIAKICENVIKNT